MSMMKKKMSLGMAISDGSAASDIAEYLRSRT